jgi:hypothetical protein
MGTIIKTVRWHSSCFLPRTGDDTKDVVETALGSLIAAAVFATGYATIEKMGSGFAALFCLILLTLVIMMA